MVSAAPAAAARAVARRRARAVGRRGGACAVGLRRGGRRASTPVARGRVDSSPGRGASALRRARAAGGRARVVKSPGVPREAPVIAAARARGVPVLGELELGWRLLGAHEFVAVTGTNGKTTTVQLLGHIHREAGLAVAVAGQRRRGAAAVAASGSLAPGAVVVCEASSFQLEDAVEFAPEGAVLLNLQADHLDRHGTFEDYRGAKLRVFARQGNDDVAVAPVGLCRSRTSAAARAGSRSAPAASSTTAPATCGGTSEPLIAHGRDPPARRAQPRQRGGGGGDRARARRSTPMPCAPRCGPSPASSTGSRRSRRSAACCTSTTRRRRTSPRRSSRSRASTGRCI